jgi:threonine dehydratase
MLYAEVHPPTPLENIEALAQALSESIWLKR